MSTETKAFHPEPASTIDVSCLGCRAYQRCVCQPRQRDTPVQIRRARGAVIRARGEEDHVRYYIKLGYYSGRYPSEWIETAHGRALAEYARAVCHVLQWLLG